MNPGAGGGGRVDRHDRDERADREDEEQQQVDGPAAADVHGPEPDLYRHPRAVHPQSDPTALLAGAAGAKGGDGADLPEAAQQHQREQHHHDEDEQSRDDRDDPVPDAGCAPHVAGDVAGKHRDQRQPAEQSVPCGDEILLGPGSTKCCDG